MMSHETTTHVTELSFSGCHVNAQVVEGARQFRVREPSIVVNVGMTPVILATTLAEVIEPLGSTIVRETTIESADRLVVLSVDEERNIGQIVFDPGWVRYWQLLVEQLGEDGAVATGYKQGTPLWRSSQDTIGTVALDPLYLAGQRPTPQNPVPFQVKVNLWFATQETDCSIHNQHDFIEFHTQVFGVGHMQKFRERDAGTLYQDMVMAAGYTTPGAFCRVGDHGQFQYVWHQYVARTDCIWMAIEYHPCSTP